jgi:hypothetical protein
LFRRGLCGISMLEAPDAGPAGARPGEEDGMNGLKKTNRMALALSGAAALMLAGAACAKKGPSPQELAAERAEDAAARAEAAEIRAGLAADRAEAAAAKAEAIFQKNMRK